jgi:hypothetical protein
MALHVLSLPKCCTARRLFTLVTLARRVSICYTSFFRRRPDRISTDMLLHSHSRPVLGGPVGIAPGCGLEGPEIGVLFPAEARDLCTERFCGLRGSCLKDFIGSCPDIKLPTYLYLLLLRLRMHGALPHTPIRLHGVVLNQAQGQLHIFLTYCHVVE